MHALSHLHTGKMLGGATRKETGQGDEGRSAAASMRRDAAARMLDCWAWGVVVLLLTSCRLSQ